MIRRALCVTFLLASLSPQVWATPATLYGTSCSIAGATNVSGPDATGNNFICDSGTITWKYPAYQFGNTASACNSTNAGMVKWTGSAFQGCNGTSWGSLGSGAALSGLTSATTTNSFDNVSYAQTWTWNSLTTQTALTFSSSSETTGTLLSLSNSNTSGAGNVLSSTTASTAGTAVYAANSAASGTTYGVYGSDASTSGIAVYGVNSLGGGTGVEGQITGVSGAGKAVYGTTATTGAGYGVYGAITGASNTGYAGYFTNSSANGWGVYAPGTSPNYFAGSVGIGTTSPAAGLDVQVAQTAAAGSAYGIRGQQTLTAAANNDVLNAVYINPTFADNSKTGVTHNGLIVASGNVGIGTTSPQALLNVYGSVSPPNSAILLATLATTSGSFAVYGDASANSSGGYGVYGKGGRYGVVGQGQTGGSFSTSVSGSDYGVIGVAAHNDDRPDAQ